VKLFVYVLPITNANDLNDQTPIEDIVHDAILAYADTVGVFGIGELADAIGAGFMLSPIVNTVTGDLISGFSAPVFHATAASRCSTNLPS
jgi:hypothetical protein